MTIKHTAVSDYTILRRVMSFEICIAGKGLQSNWGRHLVAMESRKGGILFATSPKISENWSKAPHRLRAIELGDVEELYNLAYYFDIAKFDCLGIESLKEMLKERIIKIANPQHRLSQYTLGRTDKDLRERLLRKIERDRNPQAHWRLKLDIEFASGMELDELANGLGIER